MLTEEHRVVAFAHVSNVLGKRARREARGGNRPLKGALAASRRLPGGAAPGRGRRAKSAATFYAYSGHKLYGPTGIGCLWGRPELLGLMPPWQGGGSMIDRSPLRAHHLPRPPQRFEAGTPHIVGAIGLHAAIDWVEQLGLDAIHAHECALVAEARSALSEMAVSPLRPGGFSAGIVSFNVDGVHRTTPPPYWTMRGSRFAPATIAPSR
jgi:cysteine desulfurase / selenocysteine lyase